MSEKIIRIKLFKKQLEFIQRPERLGLLLAGLGFGKTYNLAVWLLTKAIQNPGSACGMASKDFGQLSLALDKEIRIALNQMALKENYHYVRRISPHLQYKFKNGSNIIGLTAENYDSSFRAVNLNFLALDELAFYEEAAFKTAQGRVRIQPSQIRCATTPKGFNFVYENFIEKPPANSFVIKATTYDNPLLSPDYVESLKESYTEKLFEQECMAEFVDLTAEAAYYQFNKEIHVQTIVRSPGIPFYCTLDFNVAPFCGAFFQVIDNSIKVFDELFIPDNGDTYKAGLIIKDKCGSSVNIISDSTGANRSTVGGSNHTILKNMGFNLIYSKNPFVFDRVQHVNKMLEERRISIDPKCKNLIRCLSKTTWNKMGKLDQTKDRTLTHASDAIGYAAFRLFPPRNPIQRPIILA